MELSEKKALAQFHLLLSATRSVLTGLFKSGNPADRELAAFYLSVSYGSDVRVSGYTVRLMDVSWEDMQVENFTGWLMSKLSMALMSPTTPI